MISTTQKEHTFFVDLQEKLHGEIRSDPYSRLLYSTDASIYQMDPIGVVIPRQAEDVSILLESAFQNGIAVLPNTNIHNDFVFSASNKVKLVSGPSFPNSSLPSVTL